MDKNGIGTDATIHEHIKHVQDRGYAKQYGAIFKPTLLGTSLRYGYMGLGIEIYKPYLRAGMEREIKEVAEGLKQKDLIYNEMKQDMLKIYEIKLKAYEYAKNKVLKKCPKYNDNIMGFLQNELEEKENGFHEKSELREGLNMYMSEYIENLSKKDESIVESYDKFYWTSAEDISQEFGKEVNLKTDIMQEYESLINSQKALINNSRSQEYTEILQKGPLKILEKPKFKINKYYNANTKNAVEIDTYITNPNSRQGGLARIIVYEGIKKHIENHFEDVKNNEIYLCSTLHRDNVSSKYVSEFFGLKDSLYVQRRNGRNREVHICKISRDEYKQYLDDIEDKLITLYGYNPDNKKVPDNKMLDIIKEQLKYEEEQVGNLNVRSTGSYRGSFNGLTRKIKKIQELKEKARQIRSRMDRKIRSNILER